MSPRQPGRASIRRRLALAAAACAAAVVAGALAVGVYVSERPPTASGASAATSCSPRPCADLEGYSLWVGGVQARGDLVVLQVSFRNSSPSTHAEPRDFRLVDARNRSFAPVFDAGGCTRWPRTMFQGGAGFGPVPLCFRAAGAASPLRLRWTPDMGFFCCETDLKLT